MQQIPQVAKAIARAYRAKDATATSPAEYSFGTADVAAIIRARLAAAFKGPQFWVKTKNYAGGSSIDVYFDGLAEGAPNQKQVEALVRDYSTSGFDGFIDMAYGKSRYMMPDGSIVGTRTRGTEDSRGTHPAINDPVPAGAIIMCGGAGYVFVHNYKPQ